MTAPAEQPAADERLDKAYRDLGDGDRLLYERLGALPQTWFDADMAAAVSDLGFAVAADRLDDLYRAGLVERLEAPSAAHAPRYRMAPGAGAHAARMLSRRGNTPAVRMDVVLNAAQWLLTCALQAQIRLTPDQAYLVYRSRSSLLAARAPFGSDAQAVQWLASQQEMLIGLLRARELERWGNGPWQLVSAFWPLFQRRRRARNLWVEAHDIGLRSAVKARDPQAARQMGLSRAMGLRATGHPGEAVAALEEILTRADDHQDHRDAGQAHLEIARCHLAEGRRRDAERHLNLAACRWERVCYARGRALVHMTRGQAALAYGTSEEIKDARILLDTARARLLECGTAYDAARALTLYGQACLADGDLAAALRAAVKGAGVFAQQDAPRWQGRARELEGDVRLCQKQPGAALVSYRTAAALYAEAGDAADAARLTRMADSMTTPENPATTAP